MKSKKIHRLLIILVLMNFVVHILCMWIKNNPESFTPATVNWGFLGLLTQLTYFFAISFIVLPLAIAYKVIDNKHKCFWVIVSWVFLAQIVFFFKYFSNKLPPLPPQAGITNATLLTNAILFLIIFTTLIFIAFKFKNQKATIILTLIAALIYQIVTSIPLGNIMFLFMKKTSVILLLTAPLGLLGLIYFYTIRLLEKLEI